MSFQRLTRGAKQQNIALVRTLHHSGSHCYYYLDVSPLKQPLLERFSKGEAVKIIDLGKIIQWGYGEEPSAEHVAYMLEHHDFSQ